MVADQPPSALHCEVDGKISGNRLTLGGRVLSRADGVGRYNLVVNKAGNTGTSSIKQAGEFQTRIDETVSVGSVVLDYQAGTRYTATLTVSLGGQTSGCEFKQGDMHD